MTAFASGVPGWKTDRGQIYIKFGPARRKRLPHFRRQRRARHFPEGGGETTFYPYERWRYRYLECCGSDVVIGFFDPSMTNEYHITMDSSEKDALAKVPGAGLTLYERMAWPTNPSASRAQMELCWEPEANPFPRA